MFRPNFRNICFVLLGVLTLGGCTSSDEEVIRVEVPPVNETVFDITSGTMGYTDNAIVPALSSANVEVYSLDGPVPDIKGTASGDSAGLSQAYGASKSVEVYSLGAEMPSEDVMSYIHTSPEAMPDPENKTSINGAKVDPVTKDILN